MFGEEALIQCPHTTDYGILKQTLASVRRGMAGGNTAIGNALGVAVRVVEAGLEHLELALRHFGLGSAILLVEEQRDHDRRAD